MKKAAVLIVIVLALTLAAPVQAGDTTPSRCVDADSDPGPAWEDLHPFDPPPWLRLLRWLF